MFWHTRRLLSFLVWPGYLQSYKMGCSPRSRTSLTHASSLMHPNTALSVIFQPYATQIIHLWRCVYNWATDDTACRVVVTSYRSVLHISLSFCLQCARSHSKPRLESYGKLIISKVYLHRVVSSLQCESSLRLYTRIQVFVVTLRNSQVFGYLTFMSVLI